MLAHPDLAEPTFKRTVILLSAHSAEDGALGVVINRPLGKTLAEHAPEFSQSELAEIPLYSGGPVQNDQMILAAWEFLPEEGAFKLYFGIDDEKAISILREHPEAEVRGFLGYSGWSNGQLETELERDSWVVTPIDGKAVDQADGEALWRLILSKASPDLQLRAIEPDDPTLN
ncbi:MAG: YqgE/AlgH family protein [Verrucomicrobiota bacterium]